MLFLDPSQNSFLPVSLPLINHKLPEFHNAILGGSATCMLNNTFFLSFFKSLVTCLWCEFKLVDSWSCFKYRESVKRVFRSQTRGQLTTKPRTGGIAKQQQLQTGLRFTSTRRVQCKSSQLLEGPTRCSDTDSNDTLAWNCVHNVKH